MQRRTNTSTAKTILNVAMLHFLSFLLLLPGCLHALDYATVPGRLCDRSCSGPSLHCIFDWSIVERNLSMAGFERPVLTVMDRQVWGEEIKVPGPPIVVCKGDLVTVEVKNEGEDATSIHWHGQYQQGSQWADGVPGVTQCPISPGELSTPTTLLPSTPTTLPPLLSTLPLMSARTRVDNLSPVPMELPPDPPSMLMSAHLPVLSPLLHLLPKLLPRMLSV